MKLAKYLMVVLVGMFVLISVSPAQAVSPEEEVKNVVEGTINQILSTLKDPAYAGDEHKEKRRDTLRELIHSRFSFVIMSQYSLAKTWRDLSKEQKKEFVKLFGQLLEESYVSKIEAYTNEKIVFGDARIQKRKSLVTAQIKSKIITDTVTTPIKYSLIQSKNKEWKVYDLVIEGTSLVGNYREQFKGKSYDELIAYLKEKLK